MGCCGDTANKVLDIMKGNMLSLVDKVLNEVFLLPNIEGDFSDVRLGICYQCDFHTWLTPLEYIAFVRKHGKEFIRHINDLEKLPLLPKCSNGNGKKMFCRDCKCYLDAKVRVKKMQCIKGFWERK